MPAFAVDTSARAIARSGWNQNAASERAADVQAFGGNSLPGSSALRAQSRKASSSRARAAKRASVRGGSRGAAV
jgi:hypothetical protein